MKSKKALFGVIGAILFFIAIFALFSLTIWGTTLMGFVSEGPKMHISAKVVSSEYSTDCDIYLLNLLRFKDSVTGLTYSQKIGLSKYNHEGRIVAMEMKDIIEDDLLGLPATERINCFQLTAKGKNDKENFINYKPYGACDEKLNSHLCQAYVPDPNPEKGYIEVKMAVES